MNHNPQVISSAELSAPYTLGSARATNGYVLWLLHELINRQSADIPSPVSCVLNSVVHSIARSVLVTGSCSSRGSLDSHLDVAAGVGILGVLAVPALLIPSTHDVRTPSGLVSIPGSGHAQSRATQKTSESAISEIAGPEPRVPRLALRFSANRGPFASLPRGMRLPSLDDWLSCVRRISLSSSSRVDASLHLLPLPVSSSSILLRVPHLVSRACEARGLGTTTDRTYPPFLDIWC